MRDAPTRLTFGDQRLIIANTMVRIRLQRVGAKNQPSYRVVVIDSRAPRDSAYIDRIGHYNPLTNPAEFRIDEDRALYWLSVGAQPSDAVRVLLNKQGTFDRLARLHAGESLDALVAEYKGEDAAEAGAVAPERVAVAPAAVAAPEAEAVADVAEAPAVEESPSLLERAREAAGSVVEAVATPVVAAAGAVVDAVAAVIGSDEEE